MTTIFGIDPGVSGGIAIIDDYLRAAHPMPIIKSGSATFIDGGAIRKLIMGYKDSMVFLERAQAMPKQGVVSMFNYGVNFGFLKGMLDTLQRPVELVRPADWHRDVCKGYPGNKPKEKALAACISLFPDVELKATPRSRKPHDGMVDALLIAEYGRRRLGGSK